MSFRHGKLIGIAWMALAALPLAASPLTLALDTGGTNTNGNAFGNTRTFSVGGITVSVTAWGLTSSGNTIFASANSGQYAGLGLGVCNQSEGLGCSDPSHQLDNSNGTDFLLVQFSAPVDMNSVTLHSYCGAQCPAGGWDRDITYFTGVNTAANLNLTGAGLTTLPVGFGLGTTINNSPGTNAITVSLLGTGVKSFLLGAADPNPDSLIDRFKVQGLSFAPDHTITSVTPEPATLGTIGIALIALGLVGRRRFQRR